MTQSLSGPLKKELMMEKCICPSLDIKKTGHREDCPDGKVIPPMTRVATHPQPRLSSIVQNLVSLVKAQEVRIAQLETKLSAVLDPTRVSPANEPEKQ